MTEENQTTGYIETIKESTLKVSRRRTKALNIRLSDSEFTELQRLLEARNISGMSVSERVRKMFGRDFELYVVGVAK